MALSVASLNINGLNDTRKQMKVVSLAMYHKIDILMMQEHNVKDISGLQYLSNFFDIVFNATLNLKGGTVICINKSSGIKLLSKEMDTEGQIIGVRVSYRNLIIPIINIYAPSGTSKSGERETFFNSRILFYLRHNCENIIFGGDLIA